MLEPRRDVNCEDEQGGLHMMGQTWDFTRIYVLSDVEPDQIKFLSSSEVVLVFRPGDF